MFSFMLFSLALVTLPHDIFIFNEMRIHIACSYAEKSKFTVSVPISVENSHK